MPSKAVTLRTVAVLGAAAAVAFVWLRFGDAKATVLVAILALVISALRVLPAWPAAWLARSEPSQPEQVAAAGEALARSVLAQWMAERERRQLEDARAMAIRWTVETRYCRPSVRGTAPAAGDLAGVIAEFAARPRRLVVTGEPGSGKTGLCVLLTLELLKSSQPQRRVPVLFQMSSWNPDEHAGRWLARRLAEDYPWLATPSGYGATACTELVTQQRLLPVLDGLDELPRSRRKAAIDALQRDLAGQPFVLTCRSTEFAAAQGDELLRDALVVRLLPLDTKAAADYLLDSAADGVARWEPVLRHVAREPDGPLGITLTRPLTLFLAQTSYRRPDTDPAELLDRTKFGSVEEIERRLLDAFARTASDTRPPPPGTGRAARRPCDPERCERILTFLARTLTQRNTRDLAWWELATLVPRWVFFAVRAVIGGLVTAGLCAVVFGLVGQPWFGAAFGLIAGVVVASALEFIPAGRPG